MSPIARFFRLHWQVLPAWLLAVLFVYQYTLHSGIGISPDSVVYSSVADNLLLDLSANDFNGAAMVDFPLGYPGFLAGISFITHTTVLKAAPFINAVLFCMALLLTSVILNRYTCRSGLYKLLLLLLMAFSPCLLEVYSMLWSETLFICFTVLFLLLAGNYLREPVMRNLVWMGVCCSLAMVIRYAGISLLATGLLLVLFHGSISLKQKIKQLLLLGLIGSVLTAINLFRNSSVRGSFTGVREKALRSFWENLEGMATAFTGWCPFPAGQTKIALALLIVFLLVILVVFIFRVLQQQFYPGQETAVICFGLVYLFFMLFIASVSRFEELSSRLLSPAYIPVLILGTHWTVPFIKSRLASWRPWLCIAALIPYGLIARYQYQLNAEAWEGIKDAGMPGYTEDSWTQSPTIAYLKKQKIGFAFPAYANANDAMFFLTGLYAMPLPHKEIQQEIDQLLQKPTFYLVWFNDGVNDDLLSLDYIREHRKLLEVRSFDDGAIYLFAAP